jgi:hypothetical protein
MDSTTTLCLIRNCPSRGQTGTGTLGVHARKEQRCERRPQIACRIVLEDGGIPRRFVYRLFQGLFHSLVA